MDTNAPDWSDRLEANDLAEAIADLNAALPRMQDIGRELVRELGQVEAARIALAVLAQKPSVQELVKATGPGVVNELAQFVIGITDKLDLEQLVRHSRPNG